MTDGFEKWKRRIISFFSTRRANSSHATKQRISITLIAYSVIVRFTRWAKTAAGILRFSRME